MGDPQPRRPHRYIRRFCEIGIDDVPIVGGKNASLGELYKELSARGVRVPNGFAVVAGAYWHALATAGVLIQLEDLLAGLDPDDVGDLQQRAAQARAIVSAVDLPDDLRDEILAAYKDLKIEYGDNVSLAVRSSATAEDLPEASFAGAHETYLNVAGDEALLDAIRACYASLFTDRGIHYRSELGIAHDDVAQSVTVMKMVRSDTAASGVLFTLDTESGFRDVVFITGAYGLGENVVQGAVDPDEFYVFKPTLRSGHEAVLRRKLGEKKIRMVYADGATTTKNTTVGEERHRFCISDAEVIELAKASIVIEDHYTARAGVDRPMDIEWAKDGLDGKLYIVQARPETVASRRPRNQLELYRLESDGPTLASGRAVGGRIASGVVRSVSSADDLVRVQPGDVLVAETTNPDWEPILKLAAAVVTDRGGRTCHAAIVARELGIPAVVGTGDGSSTLESGQRVTVTCAEGDVGRVIEGSIDFSVERTDVGNIPRPKTQIMVNLGNPDLAFQTAALPNDGVGLARMEFIINEHIGIHPMALIEPERVEDQSERDAIAEMTIGAKAPSSFFVERLAEGIAMIAAAFFPKPVIVRLSDFKSNEYASLTGGRWFEPTEANPMLGFRGASRYTHPAYRAAFALECQAIRQVRGPMGLTNLIPMVPFCRRVSEAEAVSAEMAANGLVRGEDGLQIYVMCEIPNNVISLDAFAEYFDGFSIGSNDLTQLALGVDRDSALVAFDFDETEPGVMELFRMAIEGCRRTGRHSGFCGQAPSDIPEVAAFLVEHGIDSISLNPDALIPTTMSVLDLEKGAVISPR